MKEINDKLNQANSELEQKVEEENKRKEEEQEEQEEEAATMGTEEVEPTNINFAEKNEDVISLKNVKTIIEENIDSLIKKMGTGGLKHEGKKKKVVIMKYKY